MEKINTIISNNIKMIRKKRKMSLDNLSEITGVSKSMLGQIERGESNPTIAVLWKIATEMFRLPFWWRIDEKVHCWFIIKTFIR